MQKIKVLSIDGGGIRGIIPGTILTYVEKQLQTRSKNPGAKLADYFDLIAGTSTGGILTCCYLVPDENGKSKYSADFALDIYLNEGPQIFKVSKSEQYYHRIQFTLNEENSSMDDAGPQNLKNLHQVGLDYIEENKKQLDHIVDQLIGEPTDPEA